MDNKLITVGAIDRFLTRKLQSINAKGYITATVNNLANYYLKSQTYSKAEVDSMVAAIKQFVYEEANSLPQTPSEDTMYKIYLIPATESGVSQNAKQEYITVRGGTEGSYTYAWEKIGDTELDLSGYVTTQALSLALASYTTTASLNAMLADKQDKIDADHKLNTDYVSDGTNNKVFSATEKTKLGGIANEAQSNIFESIEVDEGMINGSPLVDIVSKAAKVIVASDSEVTELFATDRLVYENELGDDTVALIYRDGLTGGVKYLDFDKVGQVTVDTIRYTITPYVRFHRGKNGRSVAIHKSALSNRMYAVSNKYKLFCNLTSDGSFTWAVTVNGAASGGTVSWTAANNPTLADIVTQLNNGRNSGTTSDYLSFAVDNASNPTYIKVTQRTYSHSTFTLSNNTGGTLVDLSFYCRIGGVQQSETHRTWQAQDVVTMFPNSGFLPSNTRQYSVSGLNLSYRCGGNETRYKTYYTSNGTSSYLAEDSLSGRMSPSAFAALNGDGDATHQALYDKYEGSWEAYMAASMVKIDDTHSNGIEYQSYDNGDTQTAFLASVTTMDFDGSYVPAFPQAYAAYNIVDTDLGHNHLSTNHEIAVFMRDEKLAKINAAIAYIGGGNAISTTAYYWSVAQYNSNVAWFYSGTSGTLYSNYKCYSNGGRSLVYLN